MFIIFFCMVVTNRHTSLRWLLGNRSQRNTEKVNSLIYKNYVLFEYADGTKSYVSPEEKGRLLYEAVQPTPKASMKSEKMESSARYSDSDSCYEVPVAREKPKSYDQLDKIPKPEMKRNSSLPFDGELSSGDNGRINLPPYLVPLETSLTLPMKQKRKKKKSKGKKEETAYENQESSSPDDVAPNQFSLVDTLRPREGRNSSEPPEDAEVREITEKKEEKRFTVPWSKNSRSETKEPENSRRTSWKEAAKTAWAEGGSESEQKNETTQMKEPLEPFHEGVAESTSRHSLDVSLDEPLKPRERRSGQKKFDSNPLRKMFGGRRGGKEDANRQKELPTEEDRQRTRNEMERYEDARMSKILSDTESADHGSADKSSVSKLTSEKQPKKLMSGLFGSFRKGRSKDRVADNEPVKNPSTFEITIKEQPEDSPHHEELRTEGIVYAELDMTRPSGCVMRTDDEKTEYAEIIYPGSKLSVERAADEIRKSRENLSSSRENLTEVDEAFATSPERKKEAAV